MLKKRLIPCLLLQNGQLVKSIRFKDYQIVGNPKIAIQFFNAWAVDEIVFLDISRDRDYTSRLRTDYKFRMLATLAEIVRECSRICFVPLTVGGGIRTVEHMRELFRNGADKGGGPGCLCGRIHRAPISLRYASSSAISKGFTR